MDLCYSMISILMTPTGTLLKNSLGRVIRAEMFLTGLRKTLRLSVNHSILNNPNLGGLIYLAYVVFQLDATKMAKAYVDDIVGFLDAANKENKRILSKNDLI